MSREVITFHGSGSEKYHYEMCQTVSHRDKDSIVYRNEEYASTFWELCDVCREKEESKRSCAVQK